MKSNKIMKTSAVKLFQGTNVPDLEKKINAWIQATMDANTIVYYGDITSTNMGTDNYPNVTISVWYGP